MPRPYRGRCRGRACPAQACRAYWRIVYESRQQARCPLAVFLHLDGARAVAADHGAATPRSGCELQNASARIWNHPAVSELERPDAKEIRARVVRDLDRLAADGVFVFNMSPGRGEPKYLSPEHMNQVKFVVQEARKRGMKLWIQDECDYPSGMAGGLINTEYPQLRMQGIVADFRASVAAGQTLTSRCLRARWVRFPSKVPTKIPR